MTIKELKSLISNYPDNADVLISMDVSDWPFPLLRIFSDGIRDIREVNGRVSILLGNSNNDFSDARDNSMEIKMKSIRKEK